MINNRDKIESLPKIVGEVVDSMGETGLVIKNSLIWVVNTVIKLLIKTIKTEELKYIVVDSNEAYGCITDKRIIRRVTNITR